MKTAALLILAFAGLLACTNDPNRGGPLTALRAAISGLGASDTVAAVDVRQAITPDAIAATETGLLFVEVRQRGAQAVLIPAAQNGSVRTWATADGTTVSLDRGVLVATRGQVGDLISAQVDEVQLGLRGRASQGIRVHRSLNQNEHLHLRSFVCDYTRSAGQKAQTLAGRFTATMVVEDCVDSSGAGFVNRYWIDAAGKVRKSEQWAGDAIGVVYFELLKD